MARNKTAQGGISLRRKVTAWLAAILLVTMLSTGIATMAGQWTLRSFDTLLADNAVCYTVQNALKDETQAFARYVRQPTSETEQAYTAACTASDDGSICSITGMPNANVFPVPVGAFAITSFHSIKGPMASA